MSHNQSLPSALHVSHTWREHYTQTDVILPVPQDTGVHSVYRAQCVIARLGRFHRCAPVVIANAKHALQSPIASIGLTATAILPVILVFLRTGLGAVPAVTLCVILEHIRRNATQRTSNALPVQRDLGRTRLPPGATLHAPLEHTGLRIFASRVPQSHVVLANTEHRAHRKIPNACRAQPRSGHFRGLQNVILRATLAITVATVPFVRNAET